MKTRLECERKPQGETAGLWLVKEAATGKIIGLLEKYHDTPITKHPWKYWVGDGKDAKFLGSFYEREGGRNAAVAAIVKAAS